MKATKIRVQATQTKVSSDTLLTTLCETIVSRAAYLGFITESEVLSDTSINIGLHMRSFRIDVAHLGSNARPCRKSVKGFKKTDVPTWDQRKEFNALVNRAFCDFGLDALIVSGNYTVRTLDTGPETDWVCGGDRGTTGFSANASEEIMTLEDAIDIYDPEEKIKAYKTATAPHRREAAILRRQHIGALKAADFVGHYIYNWTKRAHVLNVISFSQIKDLKLKTSACFPLQGKTKTQAKNIHLVTKRLKGGKQWQLKN